MAKVDTNGMTSTDLKDLVQVLWTAFEGALEANENHGHEIRQLQKNVADLRGSYDKIFSELVTSYKDCGSLRNEIDIVEAICVN